MSYPSKIVESEDMNEDDTAENSAYEEKANLLLIELSNELKREKEADAEFLRWLASL